MTSVVLLSRPGVFREQQQLTNSLEAMQLQASEAFRPIKDWRLSDRQLVTTE
jgi:hypothetical protein